MMMIMMMISIGSLLRSGCSWKHREKKFPNHSKNVTSKLCVLFHWQQSQSFKTQREKKERKKRKKRGAPRFCLSYILWAQVSPYASLRSPPPLRKKKRDRRHMPERKNHGWIENVQVVHREAFSLTCWTILSYSTHTQKRSSNNKPNRSVNSTLLTSTVSCALAYLPNPNEVSQKNV